MTGELMSGEGLFRVPAALVIWVLSGWQMFQANLFSCGYFQEAPRDPPEPLSLLLGCGRHCLPELTLSYPLVLRWPAPESLAVGTLGGLLGQDSGQI